MCNLCKKILCVIFINVFIFMQNVSARDDFERLGDILTLAPFGVLIVSLGMRDYEGAWQLAAGSLATQGTIEIIKRGFEYAHLNGTSIDFAKRPCCNDYKGMPSGHAGGAFSAAGFVYYRYGWKPALPLIGLGIVTAASRVHAQKHTVWQVLVGSAIAWGWAYVFTTKYNPKTRFIVTPEVGADSFGGFYGVNVLYRW